MQSLDHATAAMRPASATANFAAKLQCHVEQSSGWGIALRWNFMPMRNSAQLRLRIDLYRFVSGLYRCVPVGAWGSESCRSFHRIAANPHGAIPGTAATNLPTAETAASVWGPALRSPSRPLPPTRLTGRIQNPLKTKAHCSMIHHPYSGLFSLATEVVGINFARCSRSFSLAAIQYPQNTTTREFGRNLEIMCLLPGKAGREE